MWAVLFSAATDTQGKSFGDCSIGKAMKDGPSSHLGGIGSPYVNRDRVAVSPMFSFPGIKHHSLALLRD
jgi:hypothetical protein